MLPGPISALQPAGRSALRCTGASSNVPPDGGIGPSDVVSGGPGTTLTRFNFQWCGNCRPF